MRPAFDGSPQPVSPARFRLSISGLMIFIAVSAVIVAPSLAPEKNTYRNLLLLFALLQCVGLAIYLFYRRLSAWIWVLILNQIYPTGFALVKQVFPYDKLSPYSLMFESALGSLTFMFGIAMTFRDIARKQAILEARFAIRSLTEQPIGPERTAEPSIPQP